MSLNIDAKSVAIGGAAVFAATQLFGSAKKTSSKSVNGLGKPASKRKSGTSTKKAGTTKAKKSTASKGKSKK